MKNTFKSELYLSFKKDVQQILHLEDENSIVNEICLLSWNVSFMPKKQRIEEILIFLKNNNSIINTFEEFQQYNILELIISLSHFRRAKY